MGNNGQPGPGTSWVPGPGRSHAGQAQQCPGWLPGLAGESDGFGGAVKGRYAAGHRLGNLPPIFPARPSQAYVLLLLADLCRSSWLTG